MVSKRVLYTTDRSSRRWAVWNRFGYYPIKVKIEKLFIEIVAYLKSWFSRNYLPKRQAGQDLIIFNQIFLKNKDQNIFIHEVPIVLASCVKGLESLV